MPKLHNIILISFALGLAGCIQLYRVDIPQGNILTPEVTQNLKLGMTKRQVRFVLGTAPIVDAFHVDRWDYIYAIQQDGKPHVKQKITVFFQNDKLVKINSEPALAPPKT